MSDCGGCDGLPPLYLGDLFRMICQYQNAAGQPKSLDGVTIQSHFRNPYTKKKMAQLNIDIVNSELGQFEVSYLDTRSAEFFNLDHLIWNIRYLHAQGPESTDNFRISLVEGATNDDD